jgi:hypothetical protein
MQNDCPSDPHLEKIRSAIRLYRRGPNQGLTVGELINAVFLDLGQFERYDLVPEVARLIPASAQGELRRVVETILRPGATYAPITIGKPTNPKAWHQRMIPACQGLAIRFRQQLDMMQSDPGSAGGRRMAVDLRPELMPPPLEEAQVARLAALAARLDGAGPGQGEEDLAEFNRLAGTAIPIEEFQGISWGEDDEDWVRRVLYSRSIKPVADVTRAELAEVVRRAMPTNEYFPQHEGYMAVFDANVPLDGASNLIFYPPDYDPKTNTWGGGRPIGEYDPTPEQIVAWALGSAGKEDNQDHYS